MLGITGGDPAFQDDDGSADVNVTAALAAFAAGEGSEIDALAALAGSRLLVPVVAVLAEQLSPQGQPAAGTADDPAAPGGPAEGGPPGSSSGREGRERPGAGGEKASEMAMPTLIGLDGRRAVPAFTSVEAMQRWQADARPVPVAALHVWQVAVEDSCAVVIDVAGPVPLAVEGSRLSALARGEAAPAPWLDPDVHEMVAEALSSMLEVAEFELRPGAGDCDLVISLFLAPGQRHGDLTALATRIAEAVMGRLGGRLRRGVAIGLGDPEQDG